MIIHWLNLAVGSGLGAVLGAIADWKLGNKLRKKKELQALATEYANLTGHYESFQIKEDGTYEPTRETVEIAWDPQDGLLLASSFDAAGKPRWHSYIQMSPKYPGIGVGHYTNVNSIHGGIQQIVYSKQTHSFNVRGINHNRQEFIQLWKAKEPAKKGEDSSSLGGKASHTAKTLAL